MTASETLVESPTPGSLQPSSTKDAPKLPGVLFLLKDACLITWKTRVIIYGYAAWLLIPIIVFLLSQTIPSPYGNALQTLNSMASWALDLWLYAVTILYITFIITKEKDEEINYGAIGRRAWDKVATLLIIQLLVGLMTVFGTLLFIIPGLVIWVWTAFAMQAYIIGDRTVWAAIKHSRDLVKGRFWPVFGRLFLANVYCLVVILVCFGAFVLVGLEGSAANLIPTLEAWPSWLNVGLNLVILPLTPVFIIFRLMLYFALKKTYSLPQTEKQKTAN